MSGNYRGFNNPGTHELNAVAGRHFAKQNEIDRVNDALAEEQRKSAEQIRL